MTGFAERSGGEGAWAWRWEARSVNGRGFDLRLRLPEGCEALDAPVRARFAALFARGTITVGLRLQRTSTAAQVPDPTALGQALALLGAVETAARAAGLALAPVSADRVLAMPGVMAPADAAAFLTEARAAFLAGEADGLARALLAARQGEGRALGLLLAAQVERMGPLVAEAAASAEARAARSGALLRDRVRALLDAGTTLDEARLAQELAQIAVRADVTEELDRLRAHEAAARALLGSEEPSGRRLDFLTQELNREANTLCSKAASIELTRIGLALKALIEQLREQVQNVE